MRLRSGGRAEVCLGSEERARARVRSIERGYSPALLIAAAAVAVSACGGQPGENVAQTRDELMAGRDLTWSVLSTQPVILDVCWEDPTAAEPIVGEANRTAGSTRREWVRQALKRTWEREARVSFIGWDKCTQTPSTSFTVGQKRPNPAGENIRIKITSSGASQNAGHGSYGDRMASNVALNLHCEGQGGRTLDTCIHHLAVHEFGHVLGFYHEEERSDWTRTDCAKQTYPNMPPWWPVPGELRYGAPDGTSVMAVNGACALWNTALSPGDVAGVQRLYTRHRAGTLLSAVAGLCAEATTSGTLKTANCTEPGWAQAWTYDLYYGNLSVMQPVYHSSTRVCLEYNGTSLRTTESCADVAAQRWEFRNTSVRGYGGLCLHPVSSNGVVRAQLESCATAQKWMVERIGDISYVRIKTTEATPRCLTAANTTNGTAITVAPCTTSNTQKFALEQGGTLRLWLDTTKCVDVANVLDSDYTQGLGGPATGQVAQVFSCLSAQSNQKWHFQTAVQNSAGCLARSGNLVSPGYGLAVYACNNGVDQQWDYYW